MTNPTNLAILDGKKKFYSFEVLECWSVGVLTY